MNVIIIDNDTALVKSLAIVLETKGYKVKGFSRPEEGCFHIIQGHPIDVLIVDFVMPELNGEQVIERVKDFLPKSCKIILISGHTGLLDAEDLDTLGITMFLPKPIDLENLFEVMTA